MPEFTHYLTILSTLFTPWFVHPLRFWCALVTQCVNHGLSNIQPICAQYVRNGCGETRGISYSIPSMFLISCLFVLNLLNAITNGFEIIIYISIH